MVHTVKCVRQGQATAVLLLLRPSPIACLSSVQWRIFNYDPPVLAADPLYEHATSAFLGDLQARDLYACLTLSSSLLHFQ
jgi:hypothetical protein